MKAKGNNPPFFQYRKSTLPIAKVSDIIKTLSEQDLKWQEALFSSSEKKDKDVRESEICWIEDDILKNFIYYKFESANSDPQWGYELTDIEHIQYTKYKINGHYDWHTDYMWSEETRECRKLSMTLMLSKRDDYEGGSFEFQRFENGESHFQEINLDIGEMIVFPSILQHRIKPVTRGERKVLVAWTWGPMFK